MYATDDCVIECEQCGREFAAEGTWDVEHHDGYGTRRELFADADTCDDCQGLGSCGGTFKIDADNQFKRVPCSSHEARTRTYTEDDGSKTFLGVFCDECDKFYAEDNE